MKPEEKRRRLTAIKAVFTAAANNKDHMSQVRSTRFLFLAKNHQIDGRKKYRREEVTVEFVQKVAAEKAARAAAKAAKAAQAQAPTPDVIVLD